MPYKAPNGIVYDSYEKALQEHYVSEAFMNKNNDPRPTNVRVEEAKKRAHEEAQAYTTTQPTTKSVVTSASNSTTPLTLDTQHLNESGEYMGPDFEISLNGNNSIGSYNNLGPDNSSTWTSELNQKDLKGPESATIHYNDGLARSLHTGFETGTMLDGTPWKSEGYNLIDDFAAGSIGGALGATVAAPIVAETALENPYVAHLLRKQLPRMGKKLLTGEGRKAVGKQLASWTGEAAADGLLADGINMVTWNNIGYDDASDFFDKTSTNLGWTGNESGLSRFAKNTIKGGLDWVSTPTTKLTGKTLTGFSKATGKELPGAIKEMVSFTPMNKTGVYEATQRALISSTTQELKKDAPKQEPESPIADYVEKTVTKKPLSKNRLINNFAKKFVKTEGSNALEKTVNTGIGLVKKGFGRKHATGGNLNYLEYAKGGNIHIKKSHEGKFTEYCGGKVTEECIQKGKHSPSAKIRKQATFAANARKWKH